MGTSGFFKHQDFFSTSRFFLNILIFGGSSGFYFWNLRIFLTFWIFEHPDLLENLRIFLYVLFLEHQDLFEDLLIFLTSGSFREPPDFLCYVRIIWGNSEFSFGEPPDVLMYVRFSGFFSVDVQIFFGNLQIF